LDVVLLDTDTLSEVLKSKNTAISRNAGDYLRIHGRFTFSIITRYEILRGLRAKRATVQEARFEERCATSNVLPFTDEVVVKAADIYGVLKRTGTLINDADILIAATAIVNDLALVSNNTRHFERIPDVRVISWLYHQ
jgi:Predicted nucleic acid-binding protein, contains PIN domain